MICEPDLCHRRAFGALIGSTYRYGPYGEPDPQNLWAGCHWRGGCSKRWTAYWDPKYTETKMNGDELIQALLRTPKGGGKMLSMQLLDAIHGGYSVRNVLRLIDSDSEWVSGEGAYILAESGHGAELLSDLPLLVAHKNMRVRYWAADVFLFAANA